MRVWMFAGSPYPTEYRSTTEVAADRVTRTHTREGYRRTVTYTLGGDRLRCDVETDIPGLPAAAERRAAAADQRALERSLQRLAETVARGRPRRRLSLRTEPGLPL